METTAAKQIEASNAVYSAFVAYTRMLKEQLGEDHALVGELRKMKNEFFQFETKVEEAQTKKG